MAINDIVQQYASFLPPTFYCLPKPLFLYDLIVLFFYISTILITMYYSGYVGL